MKLLSETMGNMLRIAALQLRTSGDRMETLERVSNLVETAAVDHGAQLVCLPEAFTGLYGVKHFRSNAERWKASLSGTLTMSELAAAHGIYVCGGVIEEDEQQTLYNTIAAFGPKGEEVARYRKIHLSNVSVGQDRTSEGTILEAGSELSYFDIPSRQSEGTEETTEQENPWRVGLLNCYDLRFADVSTLHTEEPPYGLGTDVLLYPSSWLKSTGDLGHWELLLKSRALDGQCYVMGVSNARDDSQETIAFGRSSIFGPMGETLAVCEDDTKDGIVMTTLQKSHLEDVRRRIPLRTSKRRQVYQQMRSRIQSQNDGAN